MVNSEKIMDIIEKKNRKIITISIYLLFLVIFFCSSQLKYYKLNNKIFNNGTGVNIHFTGNPIDITLLKDAGFKYVRRDMFWSTIENNKSKFDFKNTGYDQLTNSLIDNGITPYYILNYSNKLYEANSSIVTEKGRKAFCKFVEEATIRYKNKGIVWEIWNEPNGGFWEPKPNYDEYALLVEEVSKVIKKNDPSGIIVAPALAGLNKQSLDWLNEILKRGMINNIDALSVHPYRGYNPETVIQDYQSLRELITKYTKKKVPIISGEWGYSTGKGWAGLNLTDQQQAEYAARMFLINHYEKIPISIWYDWKDDGTNPNNGEHNFGLRENDVTKPKLSYYSVKALNKIFNGYKYNRRIYTGNNNDYVLVFKNVDGKIRIASWTTEHSHEITIPDDIKGEVISMYGENIGSIKNSKITISSSPIYITKD
ncbi:glycoside hydrolase family 5 protein [Bacillus sp. 03113]|uniref:glycoside hydrolase family 5 protein n=1 Tax=Bacillus sp. 03113 TaxID=2578211 RepID=UPI00215B90EE|nr:glycoside hydrolase family 5 protein [Bacillus sp. 03113]